MTSERVTFEQHFTSVLAPRLADMEARRRGLVTWIVGLTIGVVVLGGVAFTLVGGLSSGPWVYFIGIGLLVAAVILGGTRVAAFKMAFKSQLIQQIVAFVDPSLQYQPDGHLGQDEFEASQIWTTGIDRYSGEDMVIGQVGATALRFSEVHAEYRTTSVDSKGRTQTRWHTIFKGVLFAADFNKHFAGRTLVLPDKAQSFLGRFGQTLQGMSASLSGRGELVKLEDPEFEREFVVIATDQIEARYILSPSLMARILAFRHKCQTDVYLSFCGAQVWIGIPAKDMFEPPIFSPVDDPALYSGYLADLQFVLSIVEDLNLNLRVWTKR